MPIYDYRCDECGKVFDVFHKVKEVEEDIVCPECRSTKHTRLLSAPSISLGATRDLPPCASGGGCDGSCGMN
jgi:putative FmdB family regulatory protein